MTLDGVSDEPISFEFDDKESILPGGSKVLGNFNCHLDQKIDDTSIERTKFVQSKTKFSRKAFQSLKMALIDTYNSFQSIGPTFAVIWSATWLTQIFIVCLGGTWLSTKKLGLWHWAICISLASFSIVVSACTRFVWILWLGKQPQRKRTRQSSIDRIRWQGAIGSIRRAIMFKEAMEIAKEKKRLDRKYSVD
jgi:ABC-type multidrug transport system fused ATPase/permease subunit